MLFVGRQNELNSWLCGLVIKVGAMPFVTSSAASNPDCAFSSRSDTDSNDGSNSSLRGDDTVFGARCDITEGK